MRAFYAGLPSIGTRRDGSGPFTSAPRRGFLRWRSDVGRTGSIKRGSSSAFRTTSHNRIPGTCPVRRHGSHWRVGPPSQLRATDQAGREVPAVQPRRSLHIVDRLADFFPFHIRDEREIEAIIPQPGDRHIDFAVIEALQNECEVHVLIMASDPHPASPGLPMRGRITLFVCSSCCTGNRP